MTTEVDRLIALAGKLTEAQRDAMLGKWGWDSPWAQETGERDLVALGLWEPRAKRWQNVLTPLGLALRNHLLATVKDRPWPT